MQLGLDWPQDWKLKVLWDQMCSVLLQVAGEAGPVGCAIGSVPVVCQDRLIW